MLFRTFVLGTDQSKLYKVSTLAIGKLCDIIYLIHESLVTVATGQ